MCVNENVRNVYYLFLYLSDSESNYRFLFVSRYVRQWDQTSNKVNSITGKNLVIFKEEKITNKQTTTKKKQETEESFHFIWHGEPVGPKQMLEHIQHLNVSHFNLFVNFFNKEKEKSLVGTWRMPEFIQRLDLCYLDLSGVNCVRFLGNSSQDFGLCTDVHVGVDFFSETAHDIFKN